MANYGGKRPGAGRKKGVPNTRTINQMRIAAEVREKTGAKSPLEVMLEATERMRRTAARYEKKGLYSKALEASRLAVDFASKAAPYVHNRLSSVEHSGPGGKDLPTPTIRVEFEDSK